MNKQTKAFTLVELLLALAITSVLVVLLVNVVSAALNVWQQGRNQIDTFSNARQMLGRIADEIKGAAASNQVQFSENLPSLNSQSPAVSAPQPGTSENVFFTAPYPNSGSGDLCVIAYRHNNDSHTLERGFLESQSAWNSGASNRYQASGYTTLNWRTIANGVLEFEIRSYSQQNLDDNSDPAASWDSIGTDVTMIGNVPRRVVVRLKIVDDKSLVTLSKVPVGSPSYNQLISRAAREFTADIALLPPH